MGRGKIEIRRIENSNNRRITFTKRMNGIIKKATELSILCGVDLSLIIFSSSGKIHEFCSAKEPHGDKLTYILKKYQDATKTRLWDAKHESLSREIERIKQENDSMKIELRHLRGEDLQSLEPCHLGQIEDALDKGYFNVKEKQGLLHMEMMRATTRNRQMLEEENRHLNFVLQQQELGFGGNVRELGQEYIQKEREFAMQVPFAYRVQPIQPNLQENK